MSLHPWFRLDEHAKYSKFASQARSALPFSFASQMHSLSRSDDEQQQSNGSALLSREVPKVPSSLSALPPKSK